MQLSIFQVDAFADQVFQGNPAAVVPLDKWFSDDILQKIAMENNLSETAFFIPYENGFHIRWFTPTMEVNLCGHATLAASHVLFHHLGYTKSTIEFKSCSGNLRVKREDEIYLLDFPSDPPRGNLQKIELLVRCFDRAPDEILKGKADYLMVFDDENYVQNVKPNLDAIGQLDAEGVIISAPGSNGVDVISRFFAPRLGILEDPVTGSAHTVLIPYWSKRLEKNKFHAHQVSRRGGALDCRLIDNRVEIGGKAVTYLEGQIIL